MFLGSSKPCAFEKNICFRFSFFCKKKNYVNFRHEFQILGIDINRTFAC